MSEPEPLIVALVGACQRVSDKTAWINSVRDTLDGMGPEEAAWKPALDERSAWEIVAHMTSWTDWAANFLRGKDTDPVDWPAVNASDPSAWGTDRAELDRALTDFEDAISRLRPEDLARPLTPDATPTTAISGFLSILVHNAYHAGQLVKLREQWARLSKP